LNNRRLLVATGLLAGQLAIRQRTDLRLTAFPRAKWLSAHLVAVLFFLLAFHLAHWLATFGSASCTVTFRAAILRANNLALWLLALHLACIGIETFAASGAHCRVTFRCAYLVALPLSTCPCALRCTAIFRWNHALLKLLCTPVFVSILTARAFALGACRCGICKS